MKTVNLIAFARNIGDQRDRSLSRKVAGELYNHILTLFLNEPNCQRVSRM